MTIRCEIVSQDRMVFEDDADIVLLPGSEGEMGILPHHAPLLTTLKYGIIKVRQKNEEHLFTVAGGVAEIQPSIVTVLADAAENIEEIDVARAEAARKHAEEALSNITPEDADLYEKLEISLKRSNLRLDAVKRHRSRKRYSSSSEG